MTSRVTPFLAAASITRLTAAWSGDAGTAASLLASGAHGRRDLRLGRNARRLVARDLPGQRRGAARVRRAVRRGSLPPRLRARLAGHVRTTPRPPPAPRCGRAPGAGPARIPPQARGGRGRPPGTREDLFAAGADEVSSSVPVWVAGHLA